MKLASRGAALALVAGALVIAGCGKTHIAYKPVAANMPPAGGPTVALRVNNERPADGGGATATVGQVRGSYGIPSSVDDADPQVVIKSVTDATTDALGQAGIGVKDGSRRTLVAAVKHYWMDGFQGYTATVKVSYALQDSAGKTLWTKEVAGGAGGTNLFRAPNSFTEDMLMNALVDLGNRTVTELKSAEFQQAVK